MVCAGHGSRLVKRTQEGRTAVSMMSPKFYSDFCLRDHVSLRVGSLRSRWPVRRLQGAAHAHRNIKVPPLSKKHTVGICDWYLLPVRVRIDPHNPLPRIECCVTEHA